DEPLSNLDARLREEVRREIKKLTTNIGVTTLYVTHDQGEAMALADRIAIMDKGCILQIGSPEDLYLRPQHPKVAQFLGALNFLRGSILDDQTVETSLGRLHIDSDVFRASIRNSDIVVAVRPECIRLSAASLDEKPNNVFPGKILSRVYLGDHRLYTVQIG